MNTWCRRKVSALERERQDFQSTIDALQEGKSLTHIHVLFVINNFIEIQCLQTIFVNFGGKLFNKTTLICFSVLVHENNDF